MSLNAFALFTQKIEEASYSLIFPFLKITLTVFSKFSHSGHNKWDPGSLSFLCSHFISYKFGMVQVFRLFRKLERPPPNL